MVLTPLLLQLTVEHGVMMIKSSRGILYILNGLSPKRSLDSRNFREVGLFSQLLCGLDAGDGRPARWGRNTVSFSEMSTPRKLHKGVSPLWPPFWTFSVVELQAEAAPGKIGTQGEFLTEIFPTSSIWSFLPTSSLLHLPIPSTGTRWVEYL